MATQRQIAANRANVLRSTGPQSVAGRQAASQNARRAGVSSQGDCDAQTLAQSDWLESLAASPPLEAMLGESPSFLEIVQSEAWLARIRARLCAVDDRIDLLISAGEFKRPAPDADGAAMLQTLGLSEIASATVRKAARRLMKDPWIAAVLDPVAALLRERALLMRYRQEAEAARRSQLQHWTTMGGDRFDVASWPSSDQN